ncbi:hypothetical protein J6590_049468 [Homalodisca vitripennis]|nr:hypothetical protein J6590_049468 [Homalodisca vitripennis]
MRQEFGSAFEPNRIEQEFGSTLELNSIEQEFGNAFELNSIEQEFGSVFESNAIEQEFGSAFKSNSIEQEFECFRAEQHRKAAFERLPSQAGISSSLSLHKTLNLETNKRKIKTLPGVLCSLLSW